MNKGIQMHNVTNENSDPNVGGGLFGGVSQEFGSQLAQSLFQGEDLNSKILAFKNKAPKPSEAHHNNLRVLYTQNTQGQREVKKDFRHIPTSAEKILDAPDLENDFYLNLLDWSSTDLLAVGLGSRVYLWNSAQGTIDELFDSNNEEVRVTSLKWMMDGSHLAIGTSESDVQLWNVDRKKQVRTMRGHMSRVSSLAWNEHILSSGSRDSSIFHHDVRVAEHHVGTLKGHTQEVCGLTWSPDGSQLASGSNDNKCLIWDKGASEARFSFEDSCAAIKALAWCPFQRNVLATGGGTADRHIRFYNTLTGSIVNSVDTKSQVCSLVWSPHERELLSSHGYSQNQLCVWKFPSMAKIAELTGHTQRVLHTAVSADGTTVCSAAADETLRFWKVWDGAAKKKQIASPKREGSLRRMNLSIR